MLRMRGSEGLVSEYEKDMLMSLVSPIVRDGFSPTILSSHRAKLTSRCQICEATRKNEACFPQEQQWQEVLESTTAPGEREVSERSRITVSLRKLMAYLPGLFERVSSMVCHNRDARHKRRNLLMDVRRVREQMLQYHLSIEDKFQILQHVSESADFGLLYELVGTSLGALAMMKNADRSKRLERSFTRARHHTVGLRSRPPRS